MNKRKGRRCWARTQHRDGAFFVISDGSRIRALSDKECERFGETVQRAIDKVGVAPKPHWFHAFNMKA